MSDRTNRNTPTEDLLRRAEHLREQTAHLFLTDADLRKARETGRE